MIKRYDTTQNAFVDIETVKRYDTTQNAWVDAESAKRYDTSQNAWVKAWESCITFKEAARLNTMRLSKFSVSDDGLTAKAIFGDYYKDYITFVADGLDIPAGSTITCDYTNNPSWGDSFAECSVWLTGWNNGNSAYRGLSYMGNSNKGTFSFTAPANYGSIFKIEVRLIRLDETSLDEECSASVSNFVAGGKKFKFPPIS